MKPSAMEIFSSFLDGEVAPSELEACIDRLLSDSEWQRCWDRVHMTRSLLAGYGDHHPGSHFSQAVAEKLERAEL